MKAIKTKPQALHECSSDDQRIKCIEADLSDPRKIWGETALWCAGVNDPAKLMRQVPGVTKFKREIRDCDGERHIEWAWRKEEV